MPAEAKCFERTGLAPAQQLSNFPELGEKDVQWYLGIYPSKRVNPCTIWLYHHMPAPTLGAECFHRACGQRLELSLATLSADSG